MESRDMQKHTVVKMLYLLQGNYENRTVAQPGFPKAEVMVPGSHDFQLQKTLTSKKRSSTMLLHLIK